MRILFLLTVLTLGLTACQKEKSAKPDYLAWKGGKAISINNEPTLGLLDCRSLKTEKDHYYLESYMAWPDKNDYTQTTSPQGLTVTFIPNTDLYLQHITLDESSSQHEGLYLVKTAFQITQLSATHYRYEIIATPETVAYFFAYGSDDLRQIKVNESFIVVEIEGSQFKVTKHPSSVYVNESFSCQQSNQGQF